MHLTSIDTTASLPLQVGPPQRIALFLYDLSLTGVVRNGLRLADALADAGHVVHLLVCREGDCGVPVLHPRVKVVEIGHPAHARLPRGLALALAVPALRRHLSALAADAVVSLGNHGHLAALAASVGLDMRRIYRISNDLHHPGDNALIRLVRRATTALLVRSATRVMLVSPHLARDPAFAPARDTGKLRIVANGVAVRRVRQLAEPACGHPWLDDRRIPCIVAIGRLTAQKNHTTLLDAIAIANRDRPVRLLVLGGGTAAARDKLLSRIADLGLVGKVTLLEPVNNPFPLLARASTFALPSLWEGASNALLEAIALDVPIVAARTAGNAQEVLAYGRYGLLVDPLDADAMAQSILLQIGPEACRPGDRAADFDAAQATARACRLILEDATSGSPRQMRDSAPSALAGAAS